MLSLAQALKQEGEQRGEARGRAEGEASGKAQAVLDLLEARHVSLSAPERERILGCQDLGVLKQWLLKSTAVMKGSELFH